MNSETSRRRSSCEPLPVVTVDSNYPVNAVVKIQINSQMLDADSDASISRTVGDSEDEKMIVDCLVTLGNIKSSTGQRVADDGTNKLNGTAGTRYLNYMIVLLL